MCCAVTVCCAVTMCCAVLCLCAVDACCVYVLCRCAVRWASSIVRLRGNGSTPTVGVGAYSEGLGDDLNKAIWSAIAEDPSLTADEVRESRY